MIRRKFSISVIGWNLIFLIWTLFCCAWSKDRHVSQEFSLESKDGFFDSKGVRIHYIDQGQGEPVILIHGFALNVNRMKESGIITALVKEGYRTIALDCRGHGQSEKPHDPELYGLEMVSDIVRLLDHLNIKKAHVVGYSMGGIISNKLRQTNPERLQTITLGGAGWMKEGGFAIGDLRGIEIAESLEKTGSFELMLRRFEKDRNPPPTEKQIQSRNQRMLESNDLKALAAVMRGWDQFGIPESNLHENKIPTLALIGENDPMKIHVDALKGVMSNLEITVIEGADHGALSNPIFSDSLKKFLLKHGFTAN